MIFEDILKEDSNRSKTIRQGFKGDWHFQDIHSTQVENIEVTKEGIYDSPNKILKLNGFQMIDEMD